MIPYGLQQIDSSDIDAVISVLKSDFLTQGPAVDSFENAISDYCGARYTVSTSSATAALHLACLSLDVGPGDLVWTSAITFVASANCALYCSAEVDFVDIDPNTYNICTKALEEKLLIARRQNKLPKVLVVVHFAGLPADLEKIWALSKEYGFKVIEDASHAIGSSYQSNITGCCKYSDITVFSFHPVKIVTTGEGGAAMTNDYLVYKRLRELRSHGVTRDAQDFDAIEESEIWNYQQILLGFNYRLTDIQAALGTSQLKRIDNFLKKREYISSVYDRSLKNLPLTVQFRNSDRKSSHHLYVVRVHQAIHKNLYNCLRESGVGVNLHYIPVYLHPYYKKLGFGIGYCPEAENYFKEALSLPLHVNLTDDQQEYIVEVLSRHLK